MPTPREAATILRQHFGFLADPNDPESGIGDPTGSIALSSLRGDRKRELERRISADLHTANIPREGFVPGQPGRRYLDRSAAANLASDQYDLGTVNRELAEDPFTGDAEQSRVQKTQDALDSAALTQRDEIDKQSKTLAQRNAFGDFLKKSAGYKADVSPEGQESLDLASIRKVSENRAGKPDLGAFGGGSSPIAASAGGVVDALTGLSPQAKEMVEGMVDYKIPFPSGSALRTPYWQEIIARAKMLDPSFDATQYPSRQKLRSDFASGAGAKNIRSLNTVIGHLSTLNDKTKALNNTTVPAYNAFANWLASNSGDPRIGGFDVAANAVEAELATLFKGTGGTDQEIKAWRDKLRSSSSPDQFQEVIQTAVELARSRMEALQGQYESGMGKPANFRFLTPDAESTLNKLSAVKTKTYLDDAGNPIRR